MRLLPLAPLAPLAPSPPRAPAALARLVVVLAALGACTVPIDDSRKDRRLFPARGIIRGTVTFVGPRPCSQDKRIVGNAVILAFSRQNPPPPLGLAASALNFAVVPGDQLFANEPRSSSKSVACPGATEQVSVSAPFTLSPLDAGSYILVAFYDRSGRFLPQFKYRNQPEAGDLVGGYLDTKEAEKNEANPNYAPNYLPVDVGRAREDGSFEIPTEGFLADNVPVVIGRALPTNRPYFYPQGAQEPALKTPTPQNPSGDPKYVPVLTMTQDFHVLAAPAKPNPTTLGLYEQGFPALTLIYGLAPDELSQGTDLNGPFGLPLEPSPPQGRGGLVVFSRGAPIPESSSVPALWPQIAFRKLVDDGKHEVDPQSLVVQGNARQPMVVLQGITLLDESLVKTIVGPVPLSPTTAALRDRVKVLVRPAALCIDPTNAGRGGLLVTPHVSGKSADPAEPGDRPLFDEAAVLKGLGKLVREVRQGCLPPGRYAMAAVYPTGQAWTVPNEAGGCAPLEGALVERDGVGSCSRKPRPILYSQGPRAVLEIVPPATPEGVALCKGAPVPPECSAN